jgi:hypothetical protein
MGKSGTVGRCVFVSLGWQECVPPRIRVCWREAPASPTSPTSLQRAAPREGGSEEQQLGHTQENAAPSLSELSPFAWNVVRAALPVAAPSKNEHPPWPSALLPLPVPQVQAGAAEPTRCPCCPLLFPFPSLLWLAMRSLGRRQLQRLCSKRCGFWGSRGQRREEQFHSESALTNDCSPSRAFSHVHRRACRQGRCGCCCAFSSRGRCARLLHRTGSRWCAAFARTAVRTRTCESFVPSRPSRPLASQLVACGSVGAEQCRGTTGRHHRYDASLSRVQGCLLRASRRETVRRRQGQRQDQQQQTQQGMLSSDSWLIVWCLHWCVCLYVSLCSFAPLLFPRASFLATIPGEARTRPARGTDAPWSPTRAALPGQTEREGSTRTDTTTR